MTDQAAAVDHDRDASERPALVLRDLRKAFGSAVAVDGIDLEVRRGEFVTLLGPSGSGKTTTLRMIAGFMSPSGGSIEIDGQDMTRVPPYRRDVGMVFQNYALFPHMTAAQNVAFPLRMRKQSRAEIDRRVADALELVKLRHLAERYPRQLSGGQQQRIALARAVVFEPRLLLMDEPLGALDRKLREALQLEIIRVSRELGATVLYVTHDQEEALVMSDRIAIFSEGRIEQLGSGEDLYDRPASLFVADFIGESNILRGTYEAGRRGRRLDDPGAVALAGRASGGRAGGAGRGRGRRARAPARADADPRDRRERGGGRERGRRDGRRGAQPRSRHEVRADARGRPARRGPRAARGERPRAPARRSGPLDVGGRRRPAGRRSGAARGVAAAERHWARS